MQNKNWKKKVDIGICKEIQLLESETFLLVEPEILGFEMNLEFKFLWQGMRNPVEWSIYNPHGGIQNLEFKIVLDYSSGRIGISLTIGIWNPRSTDKESEFQYLASRPDLTTSGI